jgi:hypothetical protein
MLNHLIHLSLVFVEFAWDTDIYKARQLVQERLQTAKLPENTRSGITPVSSLMGEILLLGLRSNDNSIAPMDLRTLAELRPSLPKGVEAEILFRQGDFIENAVGNLNEAIRDGAIMVTIVLLLFLLNLRTTFIILVFIPLLGLADLEGRLFQPIAIATIVSMIALLDKDMKPVKIDAQSLTATAGTREEPVKVDVTKNESDFTIHAPEPDQSIIIQYKETPDSKTITARLHYNTKTCDPCKQPEWRRACEKDKEKD